MNNPVRTIREATSSDKSVWDSVVSHPLQSWSWGDFRKATNTDVVRLAVVDQNTLVDGWQITFHTIPHTPWTIGYFPKGPIPDEMMVNELCKLGRNKQAIFIQLEPNVYSNHQSPITNHLFRPSHHPLFTKYTFILDLTKSEKELLDAMHHKTRYNIGLAQKRGVTVKEDNSSAAFDAYMRLKNETVRRQKFYAHNDEYHRRMWGTLHNAGIARLFTATYENNILAAWIIFVWHDTIYYPYGASSRDNRDVMAPNAMLWEIIRWAKGHGLKNFDLWGSLGPNADPSDPWYGFHRFKEGYAPKLVEFTGSFDLIISPLLYRWYSMFDMLRWKILTFNR